MIDPRHLAHLLAIHEQGSLSRAGEVLHVSQPALSNSIAQLEQRLGAPVLVRTARGAVVNELGSALVRRAREVRAVLAAAEAEAGLLQRGGQGLLAVGVTPSLTERFVPAVLEDLLCALPGLAVSVIEGLDGPLGEALERGELDLVLGAVGQPAVSPSGLAPAIVEEELMRDPFLLAVHAQSGLAGRETVRLADALDELWIVPRPGGSAHAYTRALFLQAGVDWPARTLSTNSVALTRQLVARLGAVALVNATTARDWGEPLRTVGLAEAGHRRIGLRRRKGSEASPAVAAFIGAARREAEKGGCLGVAP